MIILPLRSLHIQAAFVFRRFLAEKKESDANMNLDKCERNEGTFPFIKSNASLNMDRCEKRECQEEKLPLILSLFWILSNISSSLSVGISITYWAALYNPDPERPDQHNLDFNNFSGHLFLAIIHIIDLVVSNRYCNNVTRPAFLKPPNIFLCSL